MKPAPITPSGNKNLDEQEEVTHWKATLKCSGLVYHLSSREALVNKDESMRDKRMTVKEAVSKFVKNGDNVGIGGFVNVRQPVAICHEMVRQVQGPDPLLANPPTDEK